MLTEVYEVHQGCIHEGGGTIAIFATEAEAFAYAERCAELENVYFARLNKTPMFDDRPDTYDFRLYERIPPERGIVAGWQSGSDVYLVIRTPIGLTGAAQRHVEDLEQIAAREA